ncbi:hypothetical protein [Pseudomonas tohonis]|uniref:hypothetical protein n=1 Tax=Pseudomonas tohonis TaxID=2725477 RepID=UPI0022F05586|nr:hypothetical protein [Pseudomonas tohonis]
MSLLLHPGVPGPARQSVGAGLNFNRGRHPSIGLVAAHTLKDGVPDQDGGQVLAQIVIRQPALPRRSP